MSRPRLLLLLAVLLVLAIGYAWLETPRQQKVKSSVRIGKGTARPAAGSQGPGERAAVGLDFSGGERLDYKDPQRDLFRPLYAEPKSVVDIVASPLKTEPAEKVFTPPPPPPPPPKPVVQPRPVGKPIPPLKVLGSLQKADQLTVFLSSGQEVYVVKRGDRFADGLFVQDLTTEQIVINRGDGDKGITLALGKESAPQRSPRTFSPRPSGTMRPFVPSQKSLNLNAPPTIERPVKVDEENQVDP